MADGEHRAATRYCGRAYCRTSRSGGSVPSAEQDTLMARFDKLEFNPRNQSTPEAAEGDPLPATPAIG